MIPLAHQREPRPAWTRWVVTGSRATGKTWAMEEMALGRALAGEDVGFVVPAEHAAVALRSLANHASRTLLTDQDPLAWEVDSARGTVAVRKGRDAHDRGGRVQVIALGAHDRIRGDHYQTGIIDDPREEQRHLERPMIERLYQTGMQRIAFARFDSEGTGEVAVRSWFSTDAP